MIEALRALGIRITLDEWAGNAEVSGCHGHLPSGEAELFCGNAGTVMRFGTALAALGHGVYRLSGEERMHQRPIGALADALRSLGCGMEYLHNEGFPPVCVHAAGLRGGVVRFPDVESSQFISALLLAGPYVGGDLFIELDSAPPSAPYLKTTTTVMERFGVIVIDDGNRFIVASPQRYRATSFAVEPDATSATYFLAAPAVSGGRVTVAGLGMASVQGDVHFVDLLERMGCAVERRNTRLTVQGPPSDRRLQGMDVDLRAMPDTVPTLAALALFAEGPTTIRNVAHLRHKETDRLAALARELRRLGAEVDERPDGIHIRPPPCLRPAAVETYGDHRMAMSFALAGLRCPGMTINNPECCGKSFPDFFERFERMVSSGQ
jgi:3-phosphoshikimate 1-carboxyvinyltransferase